jgi:hypothetical protein
MEDSDMRKNHKIGLSVLLLIILAVTSSSPVLSQSEVQSWIKRRLTKNAGVSTRPAIALSGDNIHVVWRDDTPGNREIYYRRSLNNGDTWRKTKRLTNNVGATYSPDIAVSGNNIHLVWDDHTPGNNEIFYKRSTTNGSTWGKQKRLTHNAGGSYSPAIAVSGSHIHVVWNDDTTGNAEIFYKRSTTNGSTWGKQIRLTHSGTSYSPAIAVSGSNVHVVWFDDTPGNYEIYYKRSTDYGATWVKTKRLTKNAGNSYPPAIAVSGSNVHVIWYDDTPGNWEIYYKRSTTNGATWSKQKRLTRNAGNSSNPDITVSGSNIHVVWRDLTPGNNEIYYRRSSNNGDSWRKVKRLTKNAGDSRYPVVEVSGSNIHVAWDNCCPGSYDIFYKRGP